MNSNTDFRSAVDYRAGTLPLSPGSSFIFSQGQNGEGDRRVIEDITATFGASRYATFIDAVLERLEALLGDGAVNWS